MTTQERTALTKHMRAERHDWLKAAARRAHRTVDAADVVIRAVERSEMDPEHARLDQLLE